MMSLLVRRLLLLLFLFLQWMPFASAAWMSHVPYCIIQPDGNRIHCFVSGDEFHNWIHDADGYTILEAGDGYYYYAEKDGGELKPSSYRVGETDPRNTTLEPWINFGESGYQRLKSSASLQTVSATAPHSGLVNNLVIYIRFQGDPEFTESRQSLEEVFNSQSSSSLKSYYAEVSYNQLNINSSQYPSCAPAANLSYQDAHPRAYYLPFNAASNQLGYTDEGERISREHTLLKHAVEYVIINSPIPAGLNLDADNDGNVDNITFVVRGQNAAWSQLLWAHSWQLFSFPVTLNGKHVWGYNFIPENQLDTRVICHEMFHSLGAPDLYHYQQDGIQPVGSWDLMETGTAHMGAWMKWKYSQHTWIGEIPEITHSGTYTLNPLESPTQQCFRIASPNSAHEFFILEYRRAEGLFESSLPGSGLLIYRIDTLATGNAAGAPDEVYIYRPNGTTTFNGSPSNAFFSLQAGRTSLNDGSNPSGFLWDGTPGGLQIYNIGPSGSSISFSVVVNEVQPPSSFTAAAPANNQIHLSWVPNIDSNEVLLVASQTNVFGIPVNGYRFPAGASLPGGGTVLYSGLATEFTHSGLGSHETWYYRAYSMTGNLSYSNYVVSQGTSLCGSVSLPLTENFNANSLPACWNYQHEGGASLDNWDVSHSTFAGGTGNEMRSTFQDVTNGTTRLLFPAVDTRGMSSLSLEFSFTLDDWTSGAWLRVQTSPDGMNWTNEAWSLATNSNQVVGPQRVQTTLTHNLNTENTYIAFTVTGNLYSYDFWYIDDVRLSCSGYIPALIEAEVVPSGTGSVIGSGTYPSTQPVDLHADPVAGWGFLNWSEDGVILSTDEHYSFPATNRTLVATFSNTHASLGLNALPAIGGTVAGGGIYPRGTMVVANAIPVQGYQFEGWKKEGIVISTDLQYTFTLNETTNLEAVFSLPPMVTYDINLQASPAAGGIVLGGGTYFNHALATVFAIPYAGWVFDSWRENNAVLSIQPGFTFTVLKSHDLQAVFRQVISVQALAFPPEAGFTTGSGDYLSGDPASLVAQSNPGWAFAKWTLNGNEVSSDSTYLFYPGNDCELTAVFVSGLGCIEGDSRGLSIYPNPVADILHITYAGIEQFSSAKVYSFSGQLILETRLNAAGENYSADVSMLPPGSYYLLLSSVSGKHYYSRFVKIS